MIEDLQPWYPIETLVPWLRKHRPDVKLGAAADVTDKAGRRALLEAWEGLLCERYGLDSTETLYEAIRHADFHATGSGPDKADPLEYWHLAAFAAFSGVIVRHELTPEDLKDLLETFQSRSDLGLAKKKNLTATEFKAQIEEALMESAFERLTDDDHPDLREVRAHIAIGFRYACCVAADYIFPDPYLLGRLTRTQFTQFNKYVEFVSRERLIPACKSVRGAGQRQIDDLAKAHASA